MGFGISLLQNAVDAPVIDFLGTIANHFITTPYESWDLPKALAEGAAVVVLRAFFSSAHYAGYTFLGPFIADLVSGGGLNLAKSVFLNRQLVLAWKFAFECPLFVKTNTNVLGRILSAIQRGIKYIPDIVAYANEPTIITSHTVDHIFRGHGNAGGRHHISALLANDTWKLIGRNKETSFGFYEATLKRPDGSTITKSFWPDSWSEFKIMDELKHVMNNNPVHIPGTNNWEGFTTNGQKIRYYVKGSDGSIISAFPTL